MIIRYNTIINGIDEDCVSTCPFEIANNAQYEKYIEDCNKWLICKDYSAHDKEKMKALRKNGELCMKHSCNLYPDLLVFKTKKEAWDMYTLMNEKGLIKEINDNDPDKEEGISYWDVVPKYEYSPVMVGSTACEHCEYCYGRSKIIADIVMVSEGNELKPRKDYYVKCCAAYRNPNWSKKINFQRKLYHLWVDKYEQKVLSLAKKLKMKRLYDYLNYR